MCNRESPIKLVYSENSPPKFEIEGWHENNGEHYCSECHLVLNISKLFALLQDETEELSESDLEEITE